MSSRRNNKYTTIDLFAGAGGMTEGFKQEGFTPLFANEFEEPALETYTRNHPEAEAAIDPVESLDPAKLRRSFKLKKGQLDSLIGGPPCQGFSTYGQRDSTDHRNRLYEYFLSFLEEFKPKTFVIENVVGILSMDGGDIIKDILSRTEALGYAVRVNTLDAVSYGVPQYRRRVFIIGTKRKVAVPPPPPTHQEGQDEQRQLFAEVESLKPFVTVRDAISDLSFEPLVPKQTHESLDYPNSSRQLSGYQQTMRNGCESLLHHSAKQMLAVRRLRLALMRPGEYGTQIRSRVEREGLPAELIDELLGGNGLRNANECRTEDREKEAQLRAVLLEGHVDLDQVLASLDSKGFANKYRRLKWDQPSHTLVAHMARDCSDFVHPDVDRFISVREAARLQSFPDEYYFCGSQFRQFRQIGNAVPPLLGVAIARAIREEIERD